MGQAEEDGAEALSALTRKTSYKDLKCTKCRHTFDEHDPSTSQPQIAPCSWVSLDYSVLREKGTHCTCPGFSSLPHDTEALSEIGRKIDEYTARRDKIGHDGLHADCCSKCRMVSMLNERLSYLGG